jgi:hypothetical protein
MGKRVDPKSIVNPSEKDNNLPSLEFIHFGITGASKEGIL